MSEEKHKPPMWKIYGMIAIIGILIGALIPTCHKVVTQSDTIELQRVRMNLLDSVSKLNKRQYDGVLEYQNGLLSLRDNQLAASNDSVDKLNSAITSLLKRHKSVTASVDTNVTTVDNSFINDCADCFDLLDKSKRLTMKLRGDQDNLSIAYKNKINTQENRIKQLGQEKDQLKSTLTSALEIAQKNQDKYQPRRKLLFTVGAIAVNATYPTGLGAGLIYQDKMNRLFGGHVFGTNVGPVYMAQIALPLSLRRLK